MYQSSVQRSSPVVLNLIIINALVFLAQVVFANDSPIGDIGQLFALHAYESQFFKPHQVITHMFMHDADMGSPFFLFHLIFNMYALWLFGSILERVWGSKRFLFFYIVSGIGAAIAQMAYWHNAFAGAANGDMQAVAMLHYSSAVGASGAVMGVLAGFAYLFPNTPLMIIPIPIPIKAKWLILGYVAYDFFSGLGGAATGIAHFAHVGGALVGFIITVFWNKTRKTFY